MIDDPFDLDLDFSSFVEDPSLETMMGMMGVPQPDATATGDLFALSASQPDALPKDPGPSRLVLERLLASTDETPGWVVIYLSSAADLHERNASSSERAALLARTIATNKVEAAHLDSHVQRHFERMRARMEGIVLGHGQALKSVAPESGQTESLTWTPYVDGTFSSSYGYEIRFLSGSHDLLSQAYRMDHPMANEESALTAARDAAKGRSQFLLISSDGEPVSITRMDARDGRPDFEHAIDSAPDEGWRLRFGNAVAEMVDAIDDGRLVPRMVIHGDRFVAAPAQPGRTRD